MTFEESDKLQDLIAKLVMAEKETTRLAMTTTSFPEYDAAAAKADEAKMILDYYIGDLVRKEMCHV